MQIRLAPGGAQLSSSRPLGISQVFCGLPPAELLERLPGLFSLCAEAQAQAAREALGAAGAEINTTSEIPVTRLSPVVEMLLEYAWRFSLDLPAWAGLDPDVANLAALRRTLRAHCQEPTAGPADVQRRAQAVAEEVAAWLQARLGLPLAEWRDLSTTELRAWWQAGAGDMAQLLGSVAKVPAGDKLPLSLLPALPDEALLSALGEQMMSEPTFLAQPSWQGQCRETGALAYQQAHPWMLALSSEHLPLARLLARLLEMDRVQQALMAGVELNFSGGLRLAPGRGLGWARTARGLLLHLVQLHEGRVSDYRILAPTEWNFHPRGQLSVSLASWPMVKAEVLESWLALQVLSLDPCVAWDWEVYDA